MLNENTKDSGLTSSDQELSDEDKKPIDYLSKLENSSDKVDKRLLHILQFRLSGSRRPTLKGSQDALP